MNVYDSQDVVNQVNQEIKNGEKTKRATEYFDTAVERYELLKSQDNANYGNNRSASSRGRNVRMGNSLLQKGRYYNSPSLYVKTKRTDRGELTKAQFRILDTSKATSKDKPIKLNGMFRLYLKSAFKGVKGAEGAYPYLKVR